MTDVRQMKAKVEAAIKRADLGAVIAESYELVQKSRRLVARGRQHGE